MSAVYFTPTFTSKPCFVFFTQIIGTGSRINQFGDPTCYDNGAWYNYSFLHIGSESGQNYCDNDRCVLNDFWLYAQAASSGSTYQFFRVRWSREFANKDERQIYMGESSQKYMWLSPYYLAFVDASASSLYFDPATKEFIFFSKSTISVDQITWEDAVKMVSNTSKSGLEFYKNSIKTAAIQSQASGGIIELKDPLESTTTTVWASNSNAGLSVTSSATADITFNTSVLSQNGALASDTMTFRNLGTTTRKFIVACTTETPTFGNAIVYLGNDKFVAKTFTVCVEGVTKTMKFLAHEPGVDI